jgi:hypothetical protein
LKIVTAISGSEQEQQLISLLSKQGFVLAFRALNISALSDYLSKTNEPLIIIFSENFGNKLESIKYLNINKKHKYVKWDLKIDSVNILKQVTNLEQTYPEIEITRFKNLISVLGSPGAPGVSTLTDYLSIKLSAKIICSNQNNLRPNDKVDVLSIDASNLVSALKKNYLAKIIIDAGSAINVAGIASDRRVGAKWAREVIGSCDKLLYVIKSDRCGLTYLHKFVKEFNNLLDPPEVIYILNQQRFNKNGQEIQIEFKRLIQDSRFFIVPFVENLPVLKSAFHPRFAFLGVSGFQKQIEKMSSYLLG